MPSHGHERSSRRLGRADLRRAVVDARVTTDLLAVRHDAAAWRPTPGRESAARVCGVQITGAPDHRVPLPCPDGAAELRPWDRHRTPSVRGRHATSWCRTRSRPYRGVNEIDHARPVLKPVDARSETARPLAQEWEGGEDPCRGCALAVQRRSWTRVAAERLLNGRDGCAASPRHQIEKTARDTTARRRVARRAGHRGSLDDRTGRRRPRSSPWRPSNAKYGNRRRRKRQIGEAQ